MRIEYLHASKFGNGAIVSAKFANAMAARGVSVEVHHIQGGGQAVEEADHGQGDQAAQGRLVEALRR
jgi:hypothetical protein